jgi:hypothetical protein
LKGKIMWLPVVGNVPTNFCRETVVAEQGDGPASGSCDVESHRGGDAAGDYTQASRFGTIGFGKLLGAAAILAAATSPSFATTLTYDFSARIGLAVVEGPDLTLQSVQPGDVLRGTLTVDTSLQDVNASPDIGQYVATATPSLLSLTIGPYGPFPQETFSTSHFVVRVAENGNGFFGTEELLIFNDGSFSAFGNQVDNFEIRLDSDSPSFLSGTGFPAAVDLGLLNAHSTFELSGNEFNAFEFLGSITNFAVPTNTTPEPGSMVLLAGGLLALGISIRRR